MRKKPIMIAGVLGVLAVAAMAVWGTVIHQRQEASLKTLVELKIIGIILANTDAYPHKMPRDFEEFEPVLKSYDTKDMEQAFGRRDFDCCRSIREGRYTILWGCDDLDELRKVTPSGQICVAYERDAASKGGWVLSLDGTTDRLTPDAFKTLTFPTLK